MKSLRIAELPSNEYEELVKQMASQVKNLAYLKSEEYAHQALKQIENIDIFEITPKASFSITINFDFSNAVLVNAIAQIKREQGNHG